MKYIDPEKTIRTADQILKGLLELPGAQQLTFVGAKLPEWRKQPQGNSDIEAVFVLNRHVHWEILIDAYYITGKKEYAERVYAELENWIDVCPCPKIVTEYEVVKNIFDTYTDADLACWRILEAGFRMFSAWKHLPELFQSYGHVSERLRNKLYVSLEQHAELFIKISPILHPKADHNHYLMENIGLFMIGYSFPKLTSARKYRESGVNEIKRCLLTQFSSWGGQIEGCPYYHNEILDLLLSILQKIKKSGIVIEKKYTDRITHALLYSIYTTRPNGTITTFGDSDACHISEYKNVYKEIKRISFVELPLFYWEKATGQFFLRSGWSEKDANLAVICKIPVQNEHSHADACSFEFSCYGKTMLIDPGRYTYHEGELRKKFKSARYHNTLLVNGREPFKYIGTWKYGEQKEAYIERADQKEIVMHQFSYLPVCHTRKIKPYFDGNVKYFTVIDEVCNLNGEYIEIIFHLDYKKYRYMKQGICFYDGKSACVIRGDTDINWRIEEGFLSERMDERRSAIRYIGKKEQNYGKVVIKTVIFAVDWKCVGFNGYQCDH